MYRYTIAPMRIFGIINIGLMEKCQKNHTRQKTMHYETMVTLMIQYTNGNNPQPFPSGRERRI